MKQDERRWVWFFALLVMAVTSVPYLLGYFLEPSEFRFSGFVFGAEDGNSYIAKMLRGASGDWLFRSPYSAFPQTGLVAFLPYLLLGKLTSAPAQHEQLVALFQIFRFFSGMVLIVAIYDFTTLFLADVKLRRLATAMIALGGGLGWLALVGMQDTLFGGRLPLEFYSPETFGFLGLFGLPHLALARALLLAGFSTYLRAVEAGKTRGTWLAGFLWLGAGLAQPLTVATGWVVLATHFCISALLGTRRMDDMPPIEVRRAGRTALMMVALSSPVVVYSFVSMLADSYLREWTLQNIILSPPPLDYMLAFLPVLPFAFVGILRMLRARPFPTLLLIAWVLVFPILAYAPQNLQRRLPEGIWVALVILAAAGLAASGSRIWRWQLAALAPGFLPAVVLVLGAGLAVSKPDMPLFHPAPEVTAFRYLAVNAPKDSVVLASFETSNRLPAWAPLRTVTGHGPESVRAAEIQPQIQKIFQSSTKQQERQIILHNLNVDYLVYGPAEKATGAWSPDADPCFRQIYQEGDYQIFEVVDLKP